MIGIILMLFFRRKTILSLAATTIGFVPASTVLAQQTTNTKDTPVKINVELQKTTNKRNYILYSQDRPLAIADFLGKYEANWFGVAATSSGISIDMSGKTVNGIMEVNVTVTVMFDKNISWMKPAGKNDRILGHEQNHFDLTAIKACEMIKALETEDYNMASLNKQIKTIHEKYVADLKTVQESYDKETNHGTIYEQQLAWSNKIKDQLAVTDCY